MAGKMDRTTIIILAIIGSLGLLSAILGFSAEGTKITHGVRMSGSCYYPQNPAVGLGICAAIFLVIAQVTIAVVGGCCGCCKSRAIPSERNSIIVVVCAVVSWIATAIAFGLFVHGASSNRSGWRAASGYYTYGYYYYGLCDVPGGGIFAGAAVLTLAATALGLTSNVLLARQPDAAPAAASVAAAAVVATPRFPQTPPKGNGQTRPPKNGQFPPPPAQGSVAPEPNQQFSPTAQRYEAHGPNHNQHVPPPAQGYEAQAPNQKLQVPPPDPGYGAHAPNQHRPPPAQAYAVQAPNVNIQFDPSTLLNRGERIHRVATLISEDGTVDESTFHDPSLYEATEPTENYIDPLGGHSEHLEEV